MPVSVRSVSSGGVRKGRGLLPPTSFLEVIFMVYTMVNTVFDLIDVFCADAFGNIVVEVCVMGACIALFRILRSVAGG